MTPPLFISRKILNNGIDQADCKLFQSEDVFKLILEEMSRLPTIDKVMWSLTCKTIASRLAVRRSSLPQTVYTHHTSAVKSRKLSFMLKMAPWFDDLSARRSAQIQEIETRPSNQIPQSIRSHRYVSVLNGFAFCVACLIYRPTQIVLMHTSNFSTQFPAATFTGPRTPGRWVRVLAYAETDRSTMRQIQRHEVGDARFETGWFTIPTDPRKLPGYTNPTSRRGTKKRKAEAGAGFDAGGSASKKASTDDNFYPTGFENRTAVFLAAARGNRNSGAQPDHAGAPPAPTPYSDAGVGGSRHYAYVETGMEHLTFLPVNAYGQRTNMMCLCPLHAIDPLQLVHANIKY
jgi:hypothetical protein